MAHLLVFMTSNALPWVWTGPSNLLLMKGKKWRDKVLLLRWRYKKWSYLSLSLSFSLPLTPLTCSLSWKLADTLWASLCNDPRGKETRVVSAQQPVKNTLFSPTAHKKLNPANNTWVRLVADPPHPRWLQSWPTPHYTCERPRTRRLS